MEEIDPAIIKGENKAKLFEQNALTRKLGTLLLIESVTGKRISNEDMAYYTRKIQELRK